MSKFSPEAYRFALYEGAGRMQSTPAAIHDTAEEAAKDITARALANIDRSDVVGHPDVLALYILPIPRGVKP